MSWPPEGMYEHVDGEAELLRRYGAEDLVYAFYRNGDDTRLSLDILDMGSAINAYGLFRLYAGCEGEEFPSYGATVLAGDWTYYAFRGRHFMRMDVEAADPRQVVTSFLSAFSSVVPDSDPLPAILGRLQEAAGATCRVRYHPEEVDYDLKLGPGYTWPGAGEKPYHLRAMESASQARAFAASLARKGAGGVRTRGSVVAWPADFEEQDPTYLENLLEWVVTDSPVRKGGS